MASTKELRRRLASVRNTRKITYAMKLVSASKLRRAQEAVVKAREYSDALLALFHEVGAARGNDQTFALLEKAAVVKRRLVFVIGGSRGLCGSFNANTNRAIWNASKATPGVEVSFATMGKKPSEFVRRRGLKSVKSWEDLADDVAKWPFAEANSYLVHSFLSGEFDEVLIISTKFRSAISNTVITKQLLPLTVPAVNTTGPQPVKLFEPSSTELFEALLPRLLQTEILQGALDTKASEYGSRMAAMDSATRNANELAAKIQLSYNKVRQASITADLLDIIGGAEALS